jgi:hypothetical protein
LLCPDCDSTIYHIAHGREILQGVVFGVENSGARTVTLAHWWVMRGKADAKRKISICEYHRERSIRHLYFNNELTYT